MRLFFTTLIIVFFQLSSFAAEHFDHGRFGVVIGEIRSNDSGQPIQFATISVAADSRFACLSDENGRFKLRAPLGEQKIVVSFMGYDKYEQTVSVTRERSEPIKIKLKPASMGIDEIVVKSESASTKVGKVAFNVQALSMGELSNTTASLSDGLSKMSGVRIRESGGVGSDTKISLNGFSGNYVKIFIDGVLQNDNGSFSISNIPANFAEHIEVYSGAAPIEFGTDALGGVINIVSKKQNKEGWDLDLSSSYGSFNTYRNNVVFTHQFENGFQYKVNAYQNYSDNNYKIDNTVVMFSGDDTSYTSSDTYTVERFNDTYHNEAIIAEMGFRGKKWADVATLSMNGSQYYKEIQTGTRQSVVYGGRHREGYSLIPTLQYSKRDLFTKGLDLKANANYNYGVVLVVDTTSYNYNWLQDKQYTESRDYTYRETQENSWAANGNATYKASESHIVGLNYSINASARVSRSSTAGVAFDDYDDPQYTTKSVTGVSYMYKLQDMFNAQAFGKCYTQSNDGVTVDDEGVSTQRNEKRSYMGYGAAATGFFLEGAQAKFSYEKAYRLPTTTELFGDSDLELGNVALNPENSDNYNASLSYRRQIKKHSTEIGGGLIYSNTKDFIRRVVSTDGETATSVNHGGVKTKGWNASLNYSYDRLFSVGGSINALNTRDNEEYDVDTGYKSLTYGQRMPNEPYLYANADGRINFYDIISKRDHFYIIYDLFYQHEFPLYWEGFGEKDTKKYVPTQYSHNITLHYSIMGGKYNFSLECKNIANAMIYDNFSLQKAGRAFYGKVRVNFGNVR